MKSTISKLYIYKITALVLYMGEYYFIAFVTIPDLVLLPVLREVFQLFLQFFVLIGQ